MSLSVPPAPNIPVPALTAKPQAGRPRSFDREQALDAAMRVFWKQGYEGASLTALTAAMGINRPSLYAAFGDKASLFREAVARYGAGPGRYVRRALGQPRARQVAEMLLRGTVAMATDTANPGGCLWVQGALVASARESMTARLQDEIDRLQDLAEINDHVRPAEIEAARGQLAALTEALGSARLRVDALRLIFRQP